MTKAKRAVIARSKNIYLSTLTLEDASSLCQWMNDPKIYGHLRDVSEVTTIDEQKQWIRQAQKDPSLEVFAIYYLPEDQLIGYGGFKNISWDDPVGEVWRVIGDSQYHNRGLGTEIRVLLCKVGFELFGFKNILGEHYSNNPASLKSALKSGATFLGTRRQAKRIKEEWFDIHYTDILSDELINGGEIQIRELPIKPTRKI